MEPTIRYILDRARYDDPEEYVFVAAFDDINNAYAVMHLLQEDDAEGKFRVRNVLSSPAALQMVKRLMSRVKALWAWCDRVPSRSMLESDIGQVPLGCVGTEINEAQQLVDDMTEVTS
jgi:hypothetical protein